MWKYKNLMLTAIAIVALVIINDVFRSTFIRSTDISYNRLSLINDILESACACILALILKKYREPSWRAFPFYGLLLISILIYANESSPQKDIVPVDQIRNSTFISYSIAIFLLLVYLFLLISAFTVKNKNIKRYFTWFGSFLIFDAVISAILRSVLTGHDMFMFGNYISLLLELPPCMVVIYLLYKLYIQYEAFMPGDVVIVNIGLENILPGTRGMILKKHNSSSYYEVEFMDDKGDLLNVLSLSSDNFERTITPDLAARVESFGR